MLFILFAASDGIHTVQSTLRFSGRERPNGNQLMPIDSGLYACIFENDVKRAESTMNLRVERKLDRILYFSHENNFDGKHSPCSGAFAIKMLKSVPSLTRKMKCVRFESKQTSISLTNPLPMLIKHHFRCVYQI